MIHIGAVMGELFFPRLLLVRIPGATLCAYLQTFNDIEYSRFREDCTPRGMPEPVLFHVEIFNQTVVQEFIFKRVCDLFAGIVVHSKMSKVSNIHCAGSKRVYRDFNEEKKCMHHSTKKNHLKMWF